MRFRGLMIAAAVLVVLGGLVWWSNVPRRPRKASRPRTLHRRSYKSRPTRFSNSRSEKRMPRQP